MRQAIQLKINGQKEEAVSLEDVHFVIRQMFESKIQKIVNKVPRSHLILLKIITEEVLDKGQLTEL